MTGATSCPREHVAPRLCWPPAPLPLCRQSRGGPPALCTQPPPRSPLCRRACAAVCGWWRAVACEGPGLLGELNLNRVKVFSRRARVSLPDYYQQRMGFITWLLPRAAQLQGAPALLPPLPLPGCLASHVPRCCLTLPPCCRKPSSNLSEHPAALPALMSWLADLTLTADRGLDDSSEAIQLRLAVAEVSFPRPPSCCFHPLSLPPLFPIDAVR